MAATIVGTSLSPGGRVSHRGFIDVIDSLHGVRGWALDLADLDQPPLLELLVGDIVLASAMPSLSRPDLSETLGTEIVAGFTFEAETLAKIAGLAVADEDVISVRIAGTSLELGMGDDPPRAEDIVGRLRELAQPARHRRRTDDLQLLLDDLRAEATAMAEQPLVPLSDSNQGFIETLSVDSRGEVWMIGWMRRGHPTEFAAVISERRKIPASVALMTYERDDLPPDATGVIGRVSTSWRPTSPHSEFHLFFGHGGRYHLVAHVPVRLITTTELTAEYSGVRNRILGTGRVLALQRLLASLESWAAAGADSQFFGAETSIDSILLVPGLGCLVEGWLISPLKRVEALRLRVGNAVMTAQPETIYWKPRLDLLSAFPGSDRLAKRAGFVALFAGSAEIDDIADPLFKIVFQDGASANFPVPAKVFRRLGHSATVEDALRFYPALEEEGFFAGFAKAAIGASLAGMNPPVAVRTTSSRAAMILVLPEDRCDLFLLFGELTHYIRARRDAQDRDAGDGGPGALGVVLVASSTANRADATWMFQELQRDTGAACSLIVIDEPTQAMAQLPDILQEIGASRFVFVGPGVFLTEAGWRLVSQIQRDPSTDLHVFGLETDDFDHQEGAHGATARCFAWNTPHYLRWAKEAPNFLGGFYRENGLLRQTSTHTIHNNAARNSRWVVPTRIQEAVNAAVYDMKTMR